MSAHVPDRRRSVRVSMDGKPRMTVERTLRVKVMEISADGALLGTDEELPVGATGRLFTTLGGQRFEAQVSVRRVNADDRLPVLHGVVVVPADPRDREALDEFLGKSGA